MDTANAADVIYAPILKWKEGEQLALRDLRIPIDDMRPVIELVPTRRPSEPKPRKGRAEPPPQRSMEMLTDQAIGKAMDAIARTPYRSRPFYLDASALEGEKIAGGKNAVAEVYDQVALRAFTAIPVIGVPSGGMPAGTFPAWAPAICYRVDASSRGGKPLDIDAIERSANGKRKHLILDFRSVAGAYVALCPSGWQTTRRPRHAACSMS